MTHFWQKISAGLSVQEEDWVKFLVEAHQKSPSMTPKAFADFKNKDGINSYQFLAQALPPLPEKAMIIDLACGDGTLIPLLLPKLADGGKIFGVDMSEAELAVAKNNIQDPRVSFHCTRAQQLPCTDHSIDAIVSHMAFMLMAPIGPVVAEIKRVLKKNGVFIAVVSETSQRRGMLQQILKSCFEFLDNRYPTLKEAPMGDPRTTSLAGWKEIFGPTATSLGRFELEVSGSTEVVWKLMQDMYFVGALPESEKQELKMKLLALAQEYAQDEVVSLQYPMQAFSFFA